MNIRKTFAAGAVSLALMLPGGLVAQDGQAEKPERHARAGTRAHGFGGHLLGRAAAELNLTEQQKQFAKQLMADTRKQAEPIAAQLRENRKELAEAVKANNVSAIDQIAQRQGTLMAQLSALHGKAMASFYAQLTPDQQAKADEFRGKFKNRAAPGMHRR